VGRDFLVQKNGRDELVECVTRAQFETAHSDNEPAERFVVGTSFLDSNEESVNGRLLILGISSDRKIFLVSSLDLKSACRRVSIKGNVIIAAMNKTVVMYDYVEYTTQFAEFNKKATYRTATVPIDLAVHDNVIAIADLMQSLSIVEIIKGTDGVDDKLEAVARHFQACWSTAVVYIDDDSYLESDHDGNLMVLRRNINGVTLEDRKRMEMTSSMNLGEGVNKIQRINIEPTARAIVVPKAFIATVRTFPLSPTPHS
jgi:DNA damage-binding protein 1